MVTRFTLPVIQFHLHLNRAARVQVPIPTRNQYELKKKYGNRCHRVIVTKRLKPRCPSHKSLYPRNNNNNNRRARPIITATVAPTATLGMTVCPWTCLHRDRRWLPHWSLRSSRYLVLQFQQPRPQAKSPAVGKRKIKLIVILPFNQHRPPVLLLAQVPVPSTLNRQNRLKSLVIKPLRRPLRTINPQ
jgi:hypothetical protein